MARKSNGFLTRIIGKFSWATPPWVNYLKNKAYERPKPFFATVLGSLALLGLIIIAAYWYSTLPKPVRVIAEITPPKITPNEKTLVPDALSIKFGIKPGNQLIPKSVAPLRSLGKEVTGVTITPEMPGKWKWVSDNNLIFTPAKDWPAGETYTIQFPDNFFTSGTKMQSLTYTFNTLPFTATINQFRFYQDPVNPKLRQAVATLSFNYPVDASRLENKISLVVQKLKDGRQDWFAKSYKFTLDYDEHKRSAYLRSEPITLPETEQYLELKLSKGIKPIAGPSVTSTEEKATVLLPDASTFFKIANANAAIVRNQKDHPEQVLNLETSLGVTSKELNKAIHVYLLPQDYPASSVEAAKLNYQWKDPGEVTANILTLAKPVALQPIPAEIEFATLHSYKFDAPSTGFIYIKIDKGVRGFGDFELTRDYAAVLKVPAYPKEIAFLHKGALLALGTEEKLSVLVRGIATVKFNFARVLPNAVNHLVTQTAGDFSNPYFINYSFNQNNISEVFSETAPFNNAEPGKEQYTALDFSKYFPAKGSTNLGLFLLHAQEWNSAQNIPLDAKADRLILITDLGMLVKDNNDSTHDVFVQSINKGTPVSQASVAMLGKNGLPLLTRNTDANGRATFPSFTDYTDDREPTVYLVKNGNDVSFIPYARADRQLNYSRFDIGGVTNNTDNPSAITAYLFSDRGIYRPGDIAHIAMIVKQAYVLPQPAGLPLDVTIIDPRGVTVKEQKISLDDSGFFAIDFQTNETAPTGQYLINLSIVKDNHASSLIGSMTINVAEFLPDRMRITAHLTSETPQGWVSPTDLNAKIGLWNLYGAPASDRRISGKLLLTPQAVTFKTYPNYTFIDPLYNPKAPPKVFTETLAETRTNEQGQAQLDLKLDRFDKATYQLTVFVEGFEAEGGRSVATQVSTLVSPLAYLVGYKSEGDLNYIKQHASQSVRFIAVDPKLQQQALPNLKLEIFSQQPVTTLVKKADGTYQYQSLVQTTLQSTDAFDINDQGSDFFLPTNSIGDFVVAIVDQNGTELSHFKYSVVGESQQPLPKNAELTLKLNKAEFAAGEEIEMQINAPYTGAGLITIERDKVYAAKWFKADTTASLQKIQIPSDFQGDGYVNIAFVRDLNSPEIFMSPLSYNIAPFSVTHKEHELAVDLSIPATARPGDQFPITYQTDKPSKIIVFAVDEGILQVSKYKAPDPLGFFFKKHALAVTTQQIVDQILPKFIADRELSAAGGDAGRSALNKNLNPFKRKTEAPVVFWSGIMDADSSPRQLQYQIPDYFNGTLRVMAVAVAANAVGAATKTAEVRGYFVINPNVPTFVAPGDEFDVTASIANNLEGSGANASVPVTLTVSPNLTIIGDAKQAIAVPEGQERPMRFRVKANEMLGSGEIKFNASLNNKTSIMKATVSIRPPIPYFTSITSGHANNAATTLKLDRVLYPAYRNVEAAVSPSPLILVAGMEHFLTAYPYGCTEQLVSKAFPWLVMANQPWFATDANIITDKIQQTIQMLSQRQLSSGGFNYWPEVGTREGNMFASIYAMHFLTEARAHGANVPSDLFSNGIGFLKDFVTQNIANLEEARLHAYAIYILTRNEIVTTNYLTHLQLALDQNPKLNWRNDITSVYIAATYQLLKSSSEANRIISYFKPQTAIESENDFYNQNIANAQYLYLIALHFPERLPKLGDKLLFSLVDTLNNDTISTILSAYTTLALEAYGELYPPPNNAVLSIDETLKDGKQNTLASANGLYQRVNLDEAASQVTFRNPNNLSYFYQLLQSGFDKNLPKGASKNGIEVYREYRNAEDNVVSSAKLGEELMVVIRVRAIDNQYHDNIAVIDLLPGGFEVVTDSVQLRNIDYADAREDRVLFFTGIGPDAKEIVYRIKATNVGEYTSPPIFAKAMYNPLVKSLGLSGTMTVVN